MADCHCRRRRRTGHHPAPIPFVSSLLPSERAKAAGAPVEVDIDKLALGEMMIVEWRGKPVWILHRTPEMLAAMKKAEPNLADPGSSEPQQPAYATNEFRSRKPELLVAVGICTHLGCSPSKAFEAARHRWAPTGPAAFCAPATVQPSISPVGYSKKNKPAHLEIPPHTFLTDARLIIGSDEKDAA